MWIDKKFEQYALNHTQAESLLLQSLIEHTYQTMLYPEKLSGRIVGKLLQFLIKISHAKHVLDIGMFTGYSSLSMAEALPEEGTVTAFEANPKAIEITKTFFDQSPHSHKIKIQFGFALELLPELQNDYYDLAFIDADKRSYLQYYEICLEKIKPGGLLIIDNAFWNGNVLDPQDEKDQVLVELNHRISQDARVENVFLTVRDGVNVVRKK